MSGVPAAYFVSHASACDAVEGVLARLENSTLRDKILGIRDAEKPWDTKVLTAGETVELPVVELTPGQANLPWTFCLSKKNNGQYFDLQFLLPVPGKKHPETTWAALYYRCQPKETAASSWIKHSGDHLAPAAGESTLHHWVSGHVDVGQSGLLQVVGYNQTLLRGYNNANPVVGLRDDVQRCVYLIPLPLDEAAIGDATQATLVAVYRPDKTRVKCTVLPRLFGVERCNTGVTNLAVTKAADEAVAYSKVIREGGDPSDTKEEQAVRAGRQEEQTGHSPQGNPDPGVIVCVPSFLPKSAIEAFRAGVCNPGNGPTFMYDSGLRYVPADRDVPVREPVTPEDHALKNHAIPLLPAGHLQGGSSILALSRGALSALPYNSVTNAGQAMNATPLLVVYCSPWMLEQAMLTPTTLYNGVIVFCPETEGLSAEGVDVPRIMKTSNIANVVAVRGPYAQVLFLLFGRLYWFAGVTLPGLVETVPAFGQEVTSMFSPAKLDGFVRSGGMGRRSLIPAVWPSSRDAFVWGEYLLPFREVLHQIQSLSLAQLTEQQTAVVDFVTAACTSRPQSDITDLATTIGQYLSTRLRRVTAPDELEREALEKALAKNPDDGEIRARLIARTRQCKTSSRRVRRGVQWLIDLLGRMVSVRGSAKFGNDLNRMHRQAAVRNNVRTASALDLNSLIELLDGLEEKEFTVLMTVLPSFELERGGTTVGLVQKAMSSIADGTFRQLVTNNRAALPCRPDARCIEMDPMTWGLHMQHSDPDMPMRPLPDDPNDPDPVSVFASAGHQSRKTPAMGFLLDPAAYTIDDPGAVNWLARSICQNPVNIWRICMREALSGAITNRDIPLICKGSPDVGYFILYTTLVTLAHLTSGLSPPSTDSAHAGGELTTVARLCRGMFDSLLSAAASGSGKPLMMLWQLVHADQKLDPIGPNESIFYRLFVQTFPFTGWDCGTLRTNIARLIVKAVTKTLGSTTAKMQEQKKATGICKELQKGRQGELDWLAQAIPFLAKVHAQNPGVITHHSLGQIYFLSRRVDISKAMDTAEQRAGMLALLVKNSPEPTCTNGYSLIRTFVGLAARENGADWTKFPHILQVALNIESKRAACFRTTKQGIASALRRSELAAAQTAMALLKIQRVKLAARFGQPTTRVQNFPGLEQAVATGAPLGIVKALGDAEQYRRPYSLPSFNSESPPPVPTDQSETTSVAALVTDEVKTPTRVEVLQNSPGGEQAARLAAEVLGMSLPRAAARLIPGIPPEDLQALFDFATSSASRRGSLVPNPCRIRVNEETGLAPLAEPVVEPSRTTGFTATDRLMQNIVLTLLENYGLADRGEKLAVDLICTGWESTNDLEHYT
jgi:hypothetical protein